MLVDRYAGLAMAFSWWWLDDRSTVVPVHAGETIGPGLFSKILQAASPEVSPSAIPTNNGTVATLKPFL
ncbi:MAG: hypothetical protein ACHBNF_05515 [Chromatiales bacterium]